MYDREYYLQNRERLIKNQTKYEQNPKNKPKIKEYKKDYNKKRREDRENYNRYAREYCAKKKQEILDILGNKCVECGYTGLALQIDHVHGNGCAERKKLGKQTVRYYLYILKKLKEGSKDYQCLCANCNFIKRLTKENHKYEGV